MIIPKNSNYKDLPDRQKKYIKLCYEQCCNIAKRLTSDLFDEWYDNHTESGYESGEPCFELKYLGEVAAMYHNRLGITPTEIWRLVKQYADIDHKDPLYTPANDRKDFKVYMEKVRNTPEFKSFKEISGLQLRFLDFATVEGSGIDV